jgi:hypothetical protein
MLPPITHMLALPLPPAPCPCPLPLPAEHPDIVMSRAVDPAFLHTFEQGQ